LEFRDRVIKIKVTADGVETILEAGDALEVMVKEHVVKLQKG
jgi:hypothetical protein